MHTRSGKLAGRVPPRRLEWCVAGVRVQIVGGDTREGVAIAFSVSREGVSRVVHHESHLHWRWTDMA